VKRNAVGQVIVDLDVTPIRAHSEKEAPSRPTPVDCPDNSGSRPRTSRLRLATASTAGGPDAQSLLTVSIIEFSGLLSSDRRVLREVTGAIHRTRAASEPIGALAEGDHTEAPSTYMS